MSDLRLPVLDERGLEAPLSDYALHTDNGSVVLEVGDDGVGFDPAHAVEIGGKDHFGLMAMRERVSMLGGTFEVESGAGAGTRIRAAVPRGEVVA